MLMHSITVLHFSVLRYAVFHHATHPDILWLSRHLMTSYVLASLHRLISVSLNITNTINNETI